MPAWPDDGAALQPFGSRPALRWLRRHSRTGARQTHPPDTDASALPRPATSGQLRLQPPRQHRRHLRQRRIVHDDDRPVGRLARCAVDDIGDVFGSRPATSDKHANRVADVLGVLADDRDRKGAAVFDQRSPVAIEQHAARRAQRNGALMVVLGELLVFFVLDDLEIPEAEREEREHDGRSPPAGSPSRIVTLRRSSMGPVKSAISNLVLQLANPQSSNLPACPSSQSSRRLILHPAAHRPPVIDEARQQIGDLKYQHADQRVGAGLAENRPERGLLRTPGRSPDKAPRI